MSKVSKKINRKLFFFVFLFLVMSICTITAYSPTHYRPIHINNTGGSEQTYYQVPLNITYDSDMKNDFSDIRVKNETSGEYVPYWIENKVNGSWCKLWFNASYIPADSWCNDTYYLYYGDASASDASDGEEVFEFFDDFDGVIDEHKAMAVGITRNEDAYLYKDFGADHFNGFEILFTAKWTAASDYGIICLVGLSNQIDDAYHWDDTGCYVMFHYDVCAADDKYKIRLQRGGNVAHDYYACSMNTVYYLKLKREANSDTVNLYIYSDPERTNLLDTLTVSGYGNTTRYRYLYAMSSFNSGASETASGYVRDVDIQEGGGTEDLTTYTEVDPNSHISVGEKEIDETKWETTYVDVSFPSSSVIRLDGNTDGYHGSIYGKETFTSGVIMWKIVEGSEKSVNTGGIDKAVEETNRDIYYWQTHHDEYSWARIRNDDDDVCDSEQEAPNRLGIVEVYFNTTFGKVKKDGVTKVSCNASTAGLKPWAASPTDQDGVACLDWCCVRKYADPEPSALLGEEQNVGGDCTAPTISSLTNSTPTTNSVTITWTTDQSADNRVKYSRNPDLSDYSWSSWDNDTTSVSITLTGLDPNTVYYYQAWSFNGTNSSCYTTEPTSQPYKNFTTQQETSGECTNPEISSLTVSDTTANSAVISWNTNQSSDNRVKYSKYSDLSNPSWSSWDNDTTSVSIILSGLKSSTTYYYQVWSYNGTNSSCYTTEPSSEPYKNFTTMSMSETESSESHDIISIKEWLSESQVMYELIFILIIVVLSVLIIRAFLFGGITEEEIIMAVKFIILTVIVLIIGVAIIQNLEGLI